MEKNPTLQHRIFVRQALTQCYKLAFHGPSCGWQQTEENAHQPDHNTEADGTRSSPQ